MMAERLSAPATEAAPTTQATPLVSAHEQRRRKLILWGAIGGSVLIVALLLLATWWAVQPQNQDYTRGARDVAIIFLAFLSLVIGGMMVALLYQVTMLTLMMRDEIKPLLESITETTNTVRGTAVFMSDKIVAPTIKAASAFAGVQRAFESLAGIRSSVNPKQRKE
jgi:uncharacterized integral membrane protein